MLKKVLVANRGEIALRVIRACQELEIPAVAVYSDADAEALHVRHADEAVNIGPPPAGKSYLNVEALIEAAKETGAEAIHPGYGFLAENARFRRGLPGRRSDVHRPFGRGHREDGQQVRGAPASPSMPDVPVVPGSEESASADEARRDGGGYRLPGHGQGGGRGRRPGHPGGRKRGGAPQGRAGRQAGGRVGLRGRLHLPGEAPGRPAPRRGPGHGRPRRATSSTSTSGSAPCSAAGRRSWRRPLAGHKPPSPREDDRGRRQAGREVEYANAGTVEFLVEGEDFYFIEMNTRIQVEHPVTEMLTGVDLVKEQIRVASGEPLSLEQEDVPFFGHAMEFRINAEDPDKDFMPSPGEISFLDVPGGPGVRVDSAIYQGYKIPPFYDSMVGKLIVWALTREEAINRARRALREYRLEGHQDHHPPPHATPRRRSIPLRRVPHGLPRRAVKEA